MTTIPYHEHLGYRALEQGENPHTHWQYSEYLKREKNDKSQRNANKLDAKRNRHAAPDVDSGEKCKGNKFIRRGKKRILDMDKGEKAKAETPE